jgi:hypothetical protein
MREFLTYGSVRGVSGDQHSYRDFRDNLTRMSAVIE